MNESSPIARRTASTSSGIAPPVPANRVENQRHPVRLVRPDAGDGLERNDGDNRAILRPEQAGRGREKQKGRNNFYIFHAQFLLVVGMFEMEYLNINVIFRGWQ